MMNSCQTCMSRSRVPCVGFLLKKRENAPTQLTDRGSCSKIDYAVVESKRVLRRRPHSLPAAPRARSKWPRGCPWVSLRPSPCPCRRSSPRQRRLLVPSPSARLMGYAARPSPLSRLRPSGPSMTLLGAYRVLSCWPAATRTVGTSQTSGLQPMCPWYAAGGPLPRAIVPDSVVL